MAGEKRPHLARRQRQQLAVDQGFDAGRADLAVEHRELAEDVPRAEGREGDRPPIGVLAGDPEASRADDVAGVGAVALMEDAGRGREGAGDGDPGEALQLPLLEVGEERHAAQQLDRGLRLLCLPHRGDYRSIAALSGL